MYTTTCTLGPSTDLLTPEETPSVISLPLLLVHPTKTDPIIDDLPTKPRLIPTSQAHHDTNTHADLDHPDIEGYLHVEADLRGLLAAATIAAPGRSLKSTTGSRTLRPRQVILGDTQSTLRPGSRPSNSGNVTVKPGLNLALTPMPAHGQEAKDYRIEQSQDQGQKQNDEHEREQYQDQDHVQDRDQNRDIIHHQGILFSRSYQRILDSLPNSPYQNGLETAHPSPLQGNGRPGQDRERRKGIMSGQVDELEIEVCFYCERERHKSKEECELRLVEGWGEQWVCTEIVGSGRICDT